MPELPEVETTRRGIAPFCQGQKITNLIIRNEQLRWPVTPNLTHKLVGQTIQKLTRRGKYLLFHLEQGTLIVHLGMSGYLRTLSHNAPTKPHDHIDLIFTNHLVRYNDTRRFGCWLWRADIASEPLLAKLGVEPLSADLNTDYLQKICKNKQRTIKTLLMDSQLIVGVGNIYANEALFVSGIHPLTPAQKLTKQQANVLVRAIKAILTDAIAAGGTTLKDFQQTDGKPGYFRHNLNVYGREACACNQCNTQLIGMKIQGRQTVFCPQCQSL